MTSIYQSVKDGQKMMTTVKTSSLEILYLMDKLLMYCQQYIKVDKSAKKNLTGKIHQKLDILISDIPSIYLEIKKNSCEIAIISQFLHLGSQTYIHWLYPRVSSNRQLCSHLLSDYQFWFLCFLSGFSC